MPNGVSCAYFAIRNHIYGTKEKNIFKKGIAGAQTTRTLDTLAQSGVLKGSAIKSASGILEKGAAIARKILYPLIIASGIYNTVKADDKVKTGVTQAGGIASMYAFEQVAEKGLDLIYNKAISSPAVQSNKILKGACYAAKGLGFVAASIAGYNTGSKYSGKVVDIIRNAKYNAYQNFPLEDDLIQDNIESTLFDEIKL